MGATGSGSLLPKLSVVVGGLAVSIAAAQGPPLLQHKCSSSAEKILSQNSQGSKHATVKAQCKGWTGIITVWKTLYLKTVQKIQ